MFSRFARLRRKLVLVINISKEQESTMERVSFVFSPYLISVLAVSSPMR